MAKILDPNHVYVPETNIWDLDEIRALDPNSDEFKELLVRLYQNMNVHAMAINRNNCCGDTSGGGGCMPWTKIDAQTGTVVEPCNGYLANGIEGRIQFFLPAEMPQGGYVAITSLRGGWELYPRLGQTITLVDGYPICGGRSHLRNVRGRPNAYMQCVCVEANTKWVAGALTGSSEAAYNDPTIIQWDTWTPPPA